MEIFVGKNDKRYGPFPIEKVNESIANGEFSLDDLGWYEELGEWKPLRNIEDIVGATVVPAVVSNPPNIASSGLGVISIISASIAWVMTIALIMKTSTMNEGEGGGFVFLWAFVAIPLMFISFITSIIGICLSSGTLKGKRLNIIGLILNISPILMVKIIGWIQD